MRARLGQHFLINEKAKKHIVDALSLKEGDTIIEIGPGHGELTDALRIRDKGLRIIGLEKDVKLAEELQRKFGFSAHVKIVQGDALKILPSLIKNWEEEIGNSDYKIAGNIPYYLTGKLMRIIGELAHPPERAVFTIQKEVAERICAAPPRMNLLAASVQFWAEPTIAGFLPRAFFSPPPEVDSAIIKLEMRNRVSGIRRDDYYKLIKILFRQPRKTILNNLSSLGERADIEKKLKALRIDPNLRPQNLSVTNIETLAKIWYDKVGIPT